jgi:hypothetical protein
MNNLLAQKIKVRTQELEGCRGALEKATRERELVVRRASAAINEALSTVKGLCLTGVREVSDPVALAYI